MSLLLEELSGSTDGATFLASISLVALTPLDMLSEYLANKQQ